MIVITDINRDKVRTITNVKRYDVHYKNDMFVLSINGDCDEYFVSEQVAANLNKDETIKKIISDTEVYRINATIKNSYEYLT